MKNIILISVVCFFIISCSEDEVICDNSNCITIVLCEPEECFEVDDGSATQNFFEADTMYKHIDFNPNNANEYVSFRDIVHYDNPVPYVTTEIFKQNLATNEFIILNTNYAGITLLKWHESGNIYFSGGSFDEARLKKMDSDGNNVTFVTNEDTWVETLEWLDNDRIMVGYNAEHFIIDFQGNIIQTENVNFGVTSPNRQKRVNIRDNGRTSSLSVYDTSTETREDIFLIKPPIYDGLVWSPDGQYIYWNDRSGVNRIHVETRKAEMVRSNCENDRFDYITFNNDGQLYGIRRTGKILNSNEYFENRPARFDFNNCTLEDITPQ